MRAAKERPVTFMRRGQVTSKGLAIRPTRQRRLRWFASVSALMLAVALSGCGTRETQSAIKAADTVLASPDDTSGVSGSASTGASQSAGGSTSTNGASTVPSGGSSPSSGASSTSGGASTTGSGSTSNVATSSGTSQSHSASTGGSSASTSATPGQTEAVGLTSCTPATGSPVAIGNTGTYSGVIGAVFAPALTGLQIWVDAANACGGLNGHQIKLYSADDQGDPSTALTETEQQVQTDHVIAEVSVFSPFSAPTVLPYLEQQGIPEIGGCNCAPQAQWWGSGDVFPAGAGWNAYGAAPAIMAHAAGHQKVAIYYCIEAPSQCQSLAQNSATEAQQLGMQVVDQEAVSLTAPSFAAQCQAAQSAGATALLVYLDGGSIQRFADDCVSSLNYKPQFFTVGLAITPQVVSDSNLNGLEAPSQTFPWSYGGTPATAAYQNAIKTYDSGFSSAGPAAASWASGVLAQVGSLDLSASNPTPAQFVKGLQSLKNESLGGLVAPASYGPNGATPPTCVFVNEMQNNQWTAPDGMQQLCG